MSRSSPPTAHGPPASLNFYGRIPIDSLQPDGDRLLFDQLIAWDPD